MLRIESRCFQDSRTEINLKRLKSTKEFKLDYCWGLGKLLQLCFYFIFCPHLQTPNEQTSYPYQCSMVLKR